MLSNQISISVALMCLPYVLIYLSSGVGIMGWLEIPIFLGYASVHRLNKAGFTWMSRIWLISLANGIVQRLLDPPARVAATFPHAATAVQLHCHLNPPSAATRDLRYGRACGLRNPAAGLGRRFRDPPVGEPA